MIQTIITIIYLLVGLGVVATGLTIVVAGLYLIKDALSLEQFLNPAKMNN